MPLKAVVKLLPVLQDPSPELSRRHHQNFFALDTMSKRERRKEIPLTQPRTLSIRDGCHRLGPRREAAVPSLDAFER